MYDSPSVPETCCVATSCTAATSAHDDSVGVATCGIPQALLLLLALQALLVIRLPYADTEALSLLLTVIVLAELVLRDVSGGAKNLLIELLALDSGEQLDTNAGDCEELLAAAAAAVAFWSRHNPPPAAAAATGRGEIGEGSAVCAAEVAVEVAAAAADDDDNDDDAPACCCRCHCMSCLASNFKYTSDGVRLQAARQQGMTRQCLPA